MPAQLGIWVMDGKLEESQDFRSWERDHYRFNTGYIDSEVSTD